MGDHTDTDARGLVLLGAILLGASLPGARGAPPASDIVGLDQTEIAALVPPSTAARDRVALGLPVPCGSTEPTVFEQLPGVGQSRAAALAAAARAGRLQRPEDLLRIPGFGTKMAARIAPRIDWCAAPAESTP